MTIINIDFVKKIATLKRESPFFYSTPETD